MTGRTGLWKFVQKLLLVCILSFDAFVLRAQSGQVVIPRVAQMPDLPSPYIMRDWKTVASEYDQLIFSTNVTGQFLPLIHLNANGVNYPAIQPIQLDTYVGSANRGNQAEAINIIPALVGATLVGIDKSDQNGVNWMVKARDFFNRANDQNVYLNGYSTTSGSDWWYDVMPNLFFYQFFSLYPPDPDLQDQFISVADRWLEAVYAMGGSATPWQIPDMNHRAWDLSTMTANNNGVLEPEAAGAIAWILYHAWMQTGNKKYLIGAELSMDFLSGLDSNPSYELQLPYGAFVAARMNAELGTHYDVEKVLNWCFDRGPLRGWGVIAGKWNGSDVSGLIGEANDAGNDYAFAMNGFQQAAAIVPMVKYDKRFAHDIAKWTLNLANASRLFYPAYLPQSDQDDYSWSAQNDADSLIAYEALKETWNGRQLYGTGDAKREGWAETNLGIYGSSHVGYLASIVDTTDVQGVLKLDVNKTDFFGQNSFTSFLLYNPHAEIKQINISTGPDAKDIYNAISETVIQTGVAGNTVIGLNPDEVMLLVLVPAGAALETKDGKLYAGETIIDYNYGYDYVGKLRIKSLAASDTLLEFNQPATIYSAVENEPEPVTYHWYVNGVLSATSTGPDLNWTAPQSAGFYTVKLNISAGAASSQDSIVVHVVEHIPKAPEIAGFATDSLWYYGGTNASVICHMKAGGEKIIQYTWTLPGGSVISQNDSLLVWSLPSQEGIFALSCEVTNTDGLKSTAQINILVKQQSTGVSNPFAYYPMDGNVLDYSGNGHHAILAGATSTDDSRGEPGKAYRFISASDIISVPNESSLNFQDQITLAFWVRLDALTEESFILSHGSWEERWKVSVTAEKKLRWTIKTSTGTKDLDSTFPLVFNQYYHFAVVYSGYSMELYADGSLDTFAPATGPMLLTTKALVFGRKDAATTGYSLKGSLDEVRIYNAAISPDEIKTLETLWDNTITGVDDEMEQTPVVYPNPSGGMIHISSQASSTRSGAGTRIRKVEGWDVWGRQIQSRRFPGNGFTFDIELNASPGIVILKIETSKNIYYRKIMIY